MTELKSKIWELTKIGIGATAGYFFRAYRDKEEYKRARIGIFKGSALIFATYMTFHNIVPSCNELTKTYLNGKQQIEQRQLDRDFIRDTMKIKRGLSSTETDKIKSSIDEKIAPIYEGQDVIVKKMDPIYETQNAVKERVESIYNSQQQNKQDLEKVTNELSKIKEEMNKPKTVQVQLQMPEGAASETYRQPRIIPAQASVDTRVNATQRAPVASLVGYELTLDKSEGEAVLRAIYSNKQAEIVGEYAASQPVNTTPNGIYEVYKTMQLSNDRAPGYLFFNKSNPNCGIAGAGLNNEHQGEIDERLVTNRNGWRINNAAFNTVYRKALQYRLMVRVQE